MKLYKIIKYFRYYCEGGAKSATPNDSTGSQCPAGYFCLEGSSAPTPCPIGTYSDTRGLTQESECSFCLGGYFCPLRGATGSDLRWTSDDFKCLAGYQCTEGAKIPDPITDGTANDGGSICDAGNYCPLGSELQEVCESGTYNPYEGQSECIECPAGKYCPEASVDFVECPVGSFCEAGSDEEEPCPAGTYSPYVNLESKEECITCPPGI